MCKIAINMSDMFLHHRILLPQVLCSMCSVPGHATVVHTTGDFAVRKLVVDTFGWLSFKHWFLEVTHICRLLSLFSELLL